jgi:hypothetical protein
MTVLDKTRLVLESALLGSFCPERVAWYSEEEPAHITPNRLAKLSIRTFWALRSLYFD